MKFLQIKYDSPQYATMLVLRNKVLREPLGLALTREDILRETNDFFCVCEDEGEIKGCCILTPQSDGKIRLRQMAIDFNCQGRGIGTQLLVFAENVAVKNHFSHMELHARETAVAFYERSGYKIVGCPFFEIGILHIKMEKELNREE
jgi:N-acetylglutamate synthase and related acetyltransferases